MDDITVEELQLQGRGAAQCGGTTLALGTQTWQAQIFRVRQRINRAEIEVFLQPCAGEANTPLERG